MATKKEKGQFYWREMNHVVPIQARSTSKKNSARSVVYRRVIASNSPKVSYSRHCWKKKCLLFPRTSQVKDDIPRSARSKLGGAEEFAWQRGTFERSRVNALRSTLRSRRCWRKRWVMTSSKEERHAFLRVGGEQLIFGNRKKQWIFIYQSIP